MSDEQPKSAISDELDKRFNEAHGAAREATRLAMQAHFAACRGERGKALSLLMLAGISAGAALDKITGLENEFEDKP